MEKSTIFLVFVSTILSFFLIANYFISQNNIKIPKFKKQACDKYFNSPPYLYLTTHSGDGVYKYSLTGKCFLDDDILKGGHLSKAQLRSVVIGKFNNSEVFACAYYIIISAYYKIFIYNFSLQALIVADSRKKNSRVVLYGPCITPRNANKTKDIGKREYIIDIIDEVTINNMKN